MDEDVLYQFIEKAKNPNTRKKTETCMKRFKAFLAMKGEIRAPQDISPSELNILIGNFILDLKKENRTDENDDGEYEPGSLSAFFAGIDRYLRSKNYEKCIMSAVEFKTAREVLKSKRQMLKAQGKGNLPNHSEPITEEEEELMWEKGVLGTGNPVSLIRTVWFLFGKLFGTRGVHEHHQMRVGDLKIKLDSDGVRYLEFQERLSKTRDGNSGGIRAFNPKAFEVRDNPDRCPVAIFEMYHDKKPAEMKTDGNKFYLAINHQRKDPDNWYMKGPMGVNKLSTFMKKMCEKAGIKGRKTNHSIRSTTCTRLLENGVSPVVIAGLKGHKNVGSLQHYAKAGMRQQRMMSHILSKNAVPQELSLQSERSTLLSFNQHQKSLPGPSAQPESVLDNGDNDVNFPDCSNRMPVLTPQCMPNQVSTATLGLVGPQTQLQGLFSGANISGGNFTFNIHVNQPGSQSTISPTLDGKVTLPVLDLVDFD